MVSPALHSASAPNSRIIHSVKSMYGREMMSPVSFSSSPSSNTGPIISSAEIYCELTLPAISKVPPVSLRPVMRSGG